MTTSAAVTQHQDETGRDRILNEAAHLFLTRGYAETSMRGIANAAQIRPASIYHHFPSKDALLKEILAIGMDAVTSAFTEAAKNPAESGPLRLERHVRAHLNALFAHQAFTAAHVTVFPFVPGDVRRAAVSERDAYEALWTSLLSDSAPHVPQETIRVVRLSLFGAMNSTVHWFDASEGSVDELASGLVRTLWNGLGAVG